MLYSSSKGYSIKFPSHSCLQGDRERLLCNKNILYLHGHARIIFAKSYTSNGKSKKNAYESVALESMKCGAKVRKGNLVDEDFKDCQIPIDGAWQKRRHTSLNGVVMGISKE